MEAIEVKRRKEKKKIQVVYTDLSVSEDTTLTHICK